MSLMGVSLRDRKENRPRRMVVAWASRSLIFFLGVGLIVKAVVREDHLQLKTLDVLKGTPKYLMDLASGRAGKDRDRLWEGLRYYTLLEKRFGPTATMAAVKGFCYEQLGEKAKAARSYKKALEKDPYLFGIYDNWARILWEAGQRKKAVDLWTRAFHLPLDKVVRYADMVSPYRQVGQEQDGAGGLERQWRWNYLGVAQSLMKAQEELKEFAAMKETALRAMSFCRHRKEKAYVYFWAGKAAAATGETGPALIYLKLASEEMPHPEVLNLIVETARRAGQIELQQTIESGLSSLPETVHAPLPALMERDPKGFFYFHHQYLTVQGKKILML